MWVIERYAPGPTGDGGRRVENLELDVQPLRDPVEQGGPIRRGLGRDVDDSQRTPSFHLIFRNVSPIRSTDAGFRLST